MKTITLLKKQLPLMLTILIGLVLFSCHKDELSFPDPSTLPKGLTGTWIETSTVTDTIVFNSDNESGYFFLSRGYEITNGYNLPKIGSAPYSYKISGDKISVTDGLSSAMTGGDYYFKFDEPNLTINIGKFCKYISTKKSTLTFRKIK
jgi:hypothetical protein